MGTHRMVVRYVRIVCAFILLALLSLIGWNTFAIAQQPAPALDQHNDLREPLIVPERNEGPRLRSPMKAPLEVFVSCYVFGGPSEFEIVTTSPQGAALLPEQKEAVEAYMKNCRRKIKKLWHPPCCLNARSTNVAIHVAADGAIYKLRFDRSSGYAECDRSAMDAIENCAPFPALPAGIDQLSLLFKFNHNPAQPTRTVMLLN
jgi:TonB family protein